MRRLDYPASLPSIREPNRLHFDYDYDPMLKPRLSLIATTIALSLAASCTTESAAPGGKAGATGSSGRGGTGGKPGNTGGKGGGGSEADASVADGAAAGSGGAGGRLGSGGRSGSGTAGNGANDPSSALFDPEVLQRFDITLPAASVDALGQTPDVYTHGALTYGDTTLADVGVRIKGESSRRTLEQKAAFKLKLDEYVANQRLLGLNRITLNNMVSDATFMAECLAYTVYRAANLPAPRCNHALVYVNDELFGVYAHIESEDKTFLRRWFSSVDGNLYEDGMSDFVSGAESSFDLQTNETANNRSDLRALIGALDSARSSTYLADLDGILDVSHYLRYTAVEAAVNQWDGYSYTYYEPNNFRIYHDPSTGKFTFIPWGHDLSMKAFPMYDDNPAPARSFIPLFTAPLYENKEGARDAGGRIFVGDRSGDPGRATGGCLGSTSCRSEYATAARDVITLYESLGLPALAASMYAQIREHVRAESRKEVSNAEFESAYQALLTHLEGRTQAMQNDLTEAGF